MFFITWTGMLSFECKHVSVKLAKCCPICLFNLLLDLGFENNVYIRNLLKVGEKLFIILKFSYIQIVLVDWGKF